MTTGLSTRTVHVPLGERAYDIHFGTGLATAATASVWASLLGARGGPAPLRAGTKVAVLADDAVAESVAQPIVSALSDAGATVFTWTIPSGEGSKAVSLAATLWERLAEAELGRDASIVAVGGGVTGDLAGFVAAAYLRGIAFVQVPTTLLAMVDSSVGGKTGVNLTAGKNLVGAFHQPVAVVIDPATLDTLPDREFRSGLAEVVKYGVILDPDLFATMETSPETILARDAETITRLVARSCELKASVVVADERETSGRREILNYGHTFAHAIEAVAGYGMLLHGEAVAIGMHAAAVLAADRGLIEAELVTRQQSLLTALGLPTVCPALPVTSLMAAMRKDKKNRQGAIRVILPTSLGEVRSFGDVPPEAIEAVWRRVGASD